MPTALDSRAAGKGVSATVARPHGRHTPALVVDELLIAPGAKGLAPRHRAVVDAW